eukprot:CAMPEP_0114580204 /NCGR_PEP_ID=MMETSP0125-20121206/4537_1 /TAXON_ID=485358 ORGANISM="Aristerostoma sp., Strain ATCC 50986" /NCGR_SAMPLE_ID=MMETSP0125 /ASSEMBLY_ACC=CAM_ASM_000245 /LENGTH=60 /DNA_ID=CAMNT_0001771627 /DNA_START=739 /DNA_END=921 /DNA_ORIENTATION=-
MTSKAAVTKANSPKEEKKIDKSPIKKTGVVTKMNSPAGGYGSMKSSKAIYGGSYSKKWYG